ncbi:hypothetical protein RCL1_000308 [Eukaryota sp. TZLM3-RCL]
MECPKCSKSFNSKTRIPFLVCSKNHSVCKSCLSGLDLCPFCNNEVLKNPERNEELSTIISSIQKGTLAKIIPSSELSLPLTSEHKLGHGGFGSVYANLWLDSSVAVKIVDLSTTAKRRLRRELEFISRLNHPLIIRVFGFVEFDNQVGIVMEKADESLPFPSSLSVQTLKYAIDIINVVKFLHSKQVIHGDLKPQNILLVDGKIKLTDFGAARLDYTCSLNPSVLSTTPKYASLESFNSKISFEGDVYSIGLILYEILCNKMAFPDDCLTGLLLKKHKSYCPPFDDGDPLELQDVIQKCLSKEVEERPSLIEIGQVLSSLLSGLQKTFVVIKTPISSAKDTVEVDQESDCLIEQGKKFISEQRHSRALEVFDQILSSSPNNIDALWNKGLVLKKLGYLNQARDCFNRVYLLNPSISTGFLTNSSLDSPRSVDCTIEIDTEPEQSTPSCSREIGKLSHSLLNSSVSNFLIEEGQLGDALSDSDSERKASEYGPCVTCLTVTLVIFGSILIIVFIVFIVVLIWNFIKKLNIF